jgi:CRISPR-associated protein Csm3
MKLIKKILLTGEIEVLTGLHIGGSSSSMNIGEMDLNVIKSPFNEQPIIPGSSLKGKLRSLLAKIEGATDIEREPKDLKNIFGYNKEQYITRLIVRDSFLKKESAQELEQLEMENKYTESKWENTINRKKGTAEHPRQLERVPSGAIFEYEMILDVYDEAESQKHLELIKKAISLLEDDYLGGSGTRGYGKVKFHQKTEQTKLISDYESH